MNARVSRHASDTATPTDAPLDRQSIDDLDAAICTLARSLNAATYRLLMLVRAFDDRMGFAKWSFASCAEWLSWRCGLSLSAAREKVRTAQALRALPAISAAFADGRLSYTKVRALTRVVEWHDEDALLAYALDATAPQVEERCREIRNANPESVGAAQRAWERRALTILRNASRGTMTISVEMPIDDGELVAQALDRAVAAGEAAIGVEFQSKPAAREGESAIGVEFQSKPAAREGESASNGWRAQQADALIAIAKAYLGGQPSTDGCVGAATADRYQVVVHVDETALHGGAGRADLPIDTIKRLTCDGSLITLVEDDDGAPLDLGRKRRAVSTALKRAVWARDRGCSFPGCHRKHYVDAHHIRHWADGGATSLDNLTLLCSLHHRLLHEGRFAIRRDERGGLYIQRPDGRVIPRFGYRPEDLRDDHEPSMEGCVPDCGFDRYAPSASVGSSEKVREPTSFYVVRRIAPHELGAAPRICRQPLDS